MAEEPNVYHLHRYYPGQAVRLRYAATLHGDLKAEHGFLVDDMDDSVADSTFWAKLTRHLDKPVVCRYAENDEKLGILGTGIEVVKAGDDRHFDEAIRRCGFAVVRPFGREGAQS